MAHVIAVITVQTDILNSDLVIPNQELIIPEDQTFDMITYSSTVVLLIYEWIKTS